MRKHKLKTFIAKAIRILVGITTSLVMSFPAGISAPTFATSISVTGYVYKDASNTPYSDIMVQIHTMDWSKNCGAQTDSTGKYTIGSNCSSALTTGAGYILEAMVPFNSTEGLIAPGPTKDITLIDGTNTMLPIVFTKAAKTLKGKVIRQNGDGISGAMVNANKMGMPAFANTQTDSTGAYSLSISGGNWMVNVNAMMGPDAPVADWVYFDPPKQVSFNDNTTTEEKSMDFSVTTANATVKGKVTKADGLTPITSGHVDLRSPDGRGNGQPLQPDGTFTIKVTAGGYDLMVNTGDMTGSKFSIPRQHIDIKDGETNDLGTIVAKERTATISGKIVDSNNVGIKNVNINANQMSTSGGPGDFTMAQTDADGNFVIYVTAGRWHVNIQPNSPQSGGTMTSPGGDTPPGGTPPPGGAPMEIIDSQSTSAFIYSGPPLEINVPTDTSQVLIDEDGIIQVTSADAIITGKVGLDSNGDGTIDEILNNFPGYAFARPKGSEPGKADPQNAQGMPFREYGGPVNNGQFTIQLPSTGLSEVTIGIHTPPDSDYAPAGDQVVTIVPNGSVSKDIILIKNNSKVWGRILDGSGFPLSSCDFRGEVFLNNFKNGVWRGSQVKADCSYSISTTPGTYQFGYHFDESAGFMNRPPSPDPIEIKTGESIERNVKIVSGDATITGKVLDPDGKPVPNVFIFADNHEEVDQFRHEAGEGPKGPPMGPQGPGGPGQPGGKPGQPQELKGLEKQGPGGAKNPKEIFEFCSKPENKAKCQADKMGEGTKGPGGCTNALECTNYCKTHKTECFGQEATLKPPTGGTPGDFIGPGGCKTETECKAFCGKPENFDACHQFTPPPGGDGGMQPFAEDSTKFSSSKGPEDSFDKMLNGGSQSDANGNFTIKILSGHIYSVGAGLPPESAFLPAKMQKADLTNVKSAFVTLQLRIADGKISGKVKQDGNLVDRGFVHAWAEDGGFSGSPVNNGTYSLNLTKGTVWHVGADSATGRELFRSEEVTIIIDKEKAITKDFAVSKSNFVMPSPASESFSADETKVITLEDGTKVTIPAGAIDTDGTVTVTATPTVDLNSSKTSKPIGVGYELEARDSDGNTVKKFNSNITVEFNYTDEQIAEAGLNEESINPSFYDTSSNTWDKITQATQDTDENTISVQTDHFSAYALTDASGQARGKSTKQISVSKNKSGVATVSIGTGSSAKTFVPFSGYKGTIQAKTANLGGKTGQIIVVAPSDKTTKATEVAVFNIKGKKTKSFKPFGATYKLGAKIILDDLTADNKEDLAMAPADGNVEVKVYDFAKNKTRNVSLGSGKGAVVIESLEAFTKGVGALTAVTVINSKTDIKVFKYNTKKSAFEWQPKFDTAKRISVADGAITLVTPKPTIKNLAPKNIKYTADTTKTVKVNAIGENFTTDTTVLISGNIPVAVKYKNSKLLQLTITPSQLKKGKTYNLTVVGADATKTTTKKALIVK